MRAIQTTFILNRNVLKTRQNQTMDEIEILSRFAAENPNPVLRVGHNGVILYTNAACDAILGALNCRVGEKLPAFLAPLVEQAQAQALHDPLTGLPNRTLLQDRLVQAIAQCVRSSKKMALVFIDLDNFKPINDAHGHAAGDR